MAEDSAAIDELMRLGIATTPVTVIDGEIVVGFDRKHLAALLGLEGCDGGPRAGSQTVPIECGFVRGSDSLEASGGLQGERKKGGRGHTPSCKPLANQPKKRPPIWLQLHRARDGPELQESLTLHFSTI